MQNMQKSMYKLHISHIYALSTWAGPDFNLKSEPEIA